MHAVTTSAVYIDDWDEDEDDQPVVVHAWPVGGAAHPMPCCGRSMLTIDDTYQQRLSLIPREVTCRG